MRIVVNVYLQFRRLLKIGSDGGRQNVLPCWQLVDRKLKSHYLLRGSGFLCRIKLNYALTRFSWILAFLPVSLRK